MPLGRIEIAWRAPSDSTYYDCSLKYPTGGSTVYVRVGGVAQTAASFATLLQTALNDAVPGSDPFTVSVSSSTGAYTISSSGSNFDFTPYAALYTYCAFLSSSYTNV